METKQDKNSVTWW